MHCVLYTQFISGSPSFRDIILISRMSLQHCEPMLIRFCKIVYKVIINFISDTAPRRGFLSYIYNEYLSGLFYIFPASNLEQIAQQVSGHRRQSPGWLKDRAEDARARTHTLETPSNTKGDRTSNETPIDIGHGTGGQSPFLG